MRKVVLWVIAGVVGFPLVLAYNGWKPSWAKPSCAEATAEARADLSTAIREGAMPYERNEITWRVVEACEPERADQLMAFCEAQDFYRDSQACRNVPINDPEGILPNLWSWIPKP